MSNTVKHALVVIQNWGDKSELLKMLANNKHVISIFHILGRYSFLVDANFDSLEQIESWINQVKSLKLSSGVPAVLQMQTQRIINVYKQKTEFSLKEYLDIKDREHFFVRVDSPHYDDKLIDMLKESDIVYSLLHVQGDNSFTIEVIVDDYDQYRSFLNRIKESTSITHIETQEVVSVIKYRNQLLDESGSLIYPLEDNRELYTL